MPEQQTVQASLAKLEPTLDEYLVKKAPALPENIKELIVKFGPYLVILGIVLAVPALLALLGLGAFMSVVPFGAIALASAGFTYILGIVFLLASLVLEAMALPGLFARSRKGWNLMYYSVLVNAVYSLVSFNLVGLVLGTLISLYILFQIKTYYK